MTFNDKLNRRFMWHDRIMSKKFCRTRNKKSLTRSQTVQACQHPNPYGVLGNFFWCPACGAMMLSPCFTTLNLKNPWTLPTNDPASVPENLRQTICWPGK
jgi:hypothetical protein